MVMSIIGFIFGIVGLLGALLWHPTTVMCIIWIVVAVLGIVLSAIGIKKGSKGLSIAGLVLSIIGVIIAIVMTVACATVDKAINTVKDELATASEEQVQGAWKILEHSLKALWVKQAQKSNPLRKKYLKQLQTKLT